MVVEKLEVIFYTAINITSLQSVLSPVQLQKTSSSFLTSFYSDKMRCVRGYYYGLCLIKKKQRPFDNLHINIGISISIERVLFWHCRVLFEKRSLLLLSVLGYSKSVSLSENYYFRAIFYLSHQSCLLVFQRKAVQFDYSEVPFHFCF